MWWFEGVVVMMRWKVCRPGEVNWKNNVLARMTPRPRAKLLNGKRSRQFWRVLTCRLEGWNRVNWWSRAGCYCIAVEIDSFLQFFDTVKRVFKSHDSTSDWPRTTLFVNLEWVIGKIHSYILQHFFFHPYPCALFLSFSYQWNICLLIALDHYLLLSLVANNVNCSVPKHCAVRLISQCVLSLQGQYWRLSFNFSIFICI